MCANKEDDAARYLIGQLADPETRRVFLVHLQTYASVRELPFAGVVTRRIYEVRGRPDVQAAIGKVGHIETYPLTAEGL